MSQTNVVSIAGIDYDSLSGLPVQKIDGAVHSDTAVHKELRKAQAISAKGVHKTQQRSTALNRQFVKKSVAPVRPVAARKSGGSMDVRRSVKRSPHISKFASEPQAVAAKRSVNIGPASHPSVKKAHAQHHSAASAKKAPPQSARDIKHSAMGKALAHAASPDQSTASQPKRRAVNIAAASLGVLLIAGYFTYVNMPNLSVRVAAAQAGIDASFPQYRPVGYRLNGPVAYQDGQVSMKFASNSGPVAFELNQARSSWDSSALLEKYVNPRSDGQYATYNDGGLTIYTYGTDAAWINGGILYTVEGDATLSNEQVRRIATSM